MRGNIARDWEAVAMDLQADIDRLRYAVALAAAWLPGPERSTVLDQACMTEAEAARLHAS